MSWGQLFHTDGCHLCETAWALLSEAGLAWQVERQEILARPEWLERYRTRIPVLRRIVITSYSIHYTKLYESTADADKPGAGAA